MKFKAKEKKRSRLPVKLKAYLDLLRPFTLLAPFIGGICGGLMALGDMGMLQYPQFTGSYPFVSWGFNHLKLIYGASTLAILNGASNVINQVYDKDIDAVNKPFRPIPSGKVSIQEAKTIAWILYILTAFRAMMINFTFAFLIIVLIFVTYAYSAPPLRLKKRFWVSNITIGIARGLLGIVCAWTLFGSIWDPVPWFVGMIICIFLIGAATTKDYTDIKGDKKHGMQTLPIVYGIKKSIAVISPFFVIPFLLVPLATLGLNGSSILPAPTIGISLFIIWGIYIIHLMRKEGLKEDQYFENSPVWVHMYLMLIAFQISFAVALILPS